MTLIQYETKKIVARIRKAAKLNSPRCIGECNTCCVWDANRNILVRLRLRGLPPRQEV
jgi:hypothetical protein